MRTETTLMLAAAAAALAACSASTAYNGPSPQAQAELAKELQGRVAGAPKNCIPNNRGMNMQIIDDYTLLYHDGRTTWLQKPRGGCNGIAIGSNTLVTRQFGTNQLCDGDINNLVDLRTGMQGGACVFGPFIPYTLPR
nr:hypothetical protein [uncultured Sphingomonas sp.]